MADGGKLIIKIDGDDSGFQKSTGSLSKIGGAALKGLAVGAAAVGTAIVAIGTSAIKAYGQYEQLVGGVDTLFKESSKQVQEYAANAYKTAGLSANEYMSTVTSFSASLLQSLGGDTQKSADYANQAVTDMSDNANKMGTSMEMIQNAYQGFAKQNYTMLDNLKLGYGGTKEEMQRLLEDAGKISGIEYDISSFADVTEAIHVMQTEMGITGTTAEEASSTIQGSIGMLKGAWENLMTGLTDPKQDIGVLIDNVFNSLITVGENLMPRIEQVLSGIGTVITKLAPPLIQAIVGLIPQLLPVIVTGIQDLANALIGAFPVIINALLSQLPSIIQTALEIIVALAMGIAQYLPELIPSVVEAVITIVETLIDNIDMLIDASIAIILALAEGLINSLPMLIEKLPEIVIKIVDALVNNAPKLVSAAFELIVMLGAGLIQAIPTLIKNIPTIIQALLNAFNAGFKIMDSIGKNIVDGLWNGIQKAKDWLLTNVREWCGSILDGIKAFFGIHSPSTVMRDDVARYIVEGFANGFEKYKSIALDAIKNFGKSTLTEAQKVIDKYNEPMTLDEMIKFEKPDYSALTLAEQRYVDDIIAYNKTQRSIERQEEAKKNKESLDEKLANAKTAAEEGKAWAEWEKAEKDRIAKEEKEDTKRQREYYEYGLKKSAEYSRDTFEAMQKDIANNEEKILQTFTEMAERSFEVMEDAEEARQGLVDKLKEYSSDLFETKTGTSALGKSYDIMVLTNFDKKNKELEKFRDNMLELQKKPDLPPEFFNIVKKLPVNDAIKFTNKLLNLNDDKFKEYIDSWKENQALTESIGTEVSADTTTQALNGVEDAFTDFSDDLETLGETNASAYGKGFLAEIKEQIPTILGALNSAFGNVIGTPSYALATAGDTGGTNTSNTNNNPVTVLGKFEIDGREFGKFTFDQMEIEGRRRGTN